MAQTAANVSAGKPAIGGAIWRAVAGTTLPTDATTALDAAFKALGYCSEDGLTNSNSPETTDIKAWGGDKVLNLEVLKAVYGSSNVSGTLSTGITVEANADEPEEGVWAIDMVMNSKTVKRVVIPHGKISEIGDISYTDSDAVGYEVTITALPDASGNTHYEYIKQTA